jgi:hypothetical protein
VEHYRPCRATLARWRRERPQPIADAWDEVSGIDGPTPFPRARTAAGRLDRAAVNKCGCSQFFDLRGNSASLGVPLELADRVIFEVAKGLKLLEVEECCEWRGRRVAARRDRPGHRCRPQSPRGSRSQHDFIIGAARDRPRRSGLPIWRLPLMRRCAEAR